MALSGIANSINTLYDGIERRVITDRVVRTVEVVVNGTRQSDTAEIILCSKLHRTRQRTIAADDDQRVDTMLLDVLIGFITPLFGHERLRACRLEDCTSPADDATDILGGEIPYLSCYQSIITSVNTLDIETVIDSCTRDGTNCRVHSWGISTRS